MTPVGAHIPAKGRYFVHDPFAIEDADRAVGHPDRNGAMGKEPNDVGRAGRGRKVPIAVQVTKERVADRAADAPRLVPRRLEPLCDVENRARGMQGGGWAVPSAGDDLAAAHRHGITPRKRPPAPIRSSRTRAPA